MLRVYRERIAVLYINNKIINTGDEPVKTLSTNTNTIARVKTPPRATAIPRATAMPRATAALFLCLAVCSSSAFAFDFGKVLKNSGGNLIKAATLSEGAIMTQSRSAVEFMDSQRDRETADAKYQQRLNKIVNRVDLPKIDGVTFNFKVYKSEPNNLNAFATPDGSIRIHTALMDAMTDNQLLGVVGHEVGHVVEKHAFKQMRKSLLTSATITAVASGSTIGAEAYNTGMGDFTNKFMNASFGKKDEISADKYALGVLENANAPLSSMKEAIEVLQAKYGDGGGMLSSHPSNPKRIKSLNKEISKASK